MSDELAYIDTTDLAARLARRELSAVEVMDATLSRIERRNPSITAFVHEAFEEARASAQDADRRLTAGDPVGPLHGVPTAMKDLFDFKPGWPVTFGGIPALRDHRVDAYCVWAERMEAAGAIIVGRTNSPALGLRGVTDNLLFGPTRNPFDVGRNSGGSSGGAAAAVADGLVPFAEGTDAGGSIRIPATSRPGAARKSTSSRALKGSRGSGPASAVMPRAASATVRVSSPSKRNGDAAPKPSGRMTMGTRPHEPLKP
ncbi:MAG: amidase [Solirubrobacteraceae bacterium]|nr:amidase [Solirubrobacteraceae bacterium]